ncbi:hypothetical protein [Priestia megaterium]|uniref:hypothetical protein n=1 Tax=Priestia megaterium TaxID=1404 RepID=UPI00234EE46A|nr:hypothetical protein [Priestia megaterium]MDC7783927.1 hypothetical protein [Priestia megaterium]
MKQKIVTWLKRGLKTNTQYKFKRFLNPLDTVDPTLLLFLITGLTYYVACLYKGSFQGYYGLPMQFAIFDLKSLSFILSSFFTLLFFSYLYYLCFIGLFYFNTSLRINLSLWIVTPLATLHLYSYLVNRIDAKSDLLLLRVSLMIVIIIFSLVVILDFFGKNFATKVVTLGVIMLVSTLYSLYLGEYEAKFKTSYLTTKIGDTSYILIDTYNQKGIFAPINTNNNEVKPQFLFLELTPKDNNKLNLKLKNIGTLKIIESK